MTVIERCQCRPTISAFRTISIIIRTTRNLSNTIIDTPALFAVNILYFVYLFTTVIVPLTFLPWKIRVAFPGESQLRLSRATQPTVHAACFSVSIPNSYTDYRIFNVRTDIDACGCTRGYTDTVRESALKIDFERKIPCRAGESNLPQRRAGPTLYLLSYIPAPILELGGGGYQAEKERLCRQNLVMEVREGSLHQQFILCRLFHFCTLSI